MLFVKILFDVNLPIWSRGEDVWSLWLYCFYVHKDDCDVNLWTWMKQGGSSQEGLWVQVAVSSCIQQSQSQTCNANNCAPYMIPNNLQFWWIQRQVEDYNRFYWIEIVHLPLTFLDHFVSIQHPLWGLTLVLLQGDWHIWQIDDHKAVAVWVNKLASSKMR